MGSYDNRLDFWLLEAQTNSNQFVENNRESLRSSDTGQVTHTQNERTQSLALFVRNVHKNQNTVNISQIHSYADMVHTNSKSFHLDFEMRQVLFNEL